MKPKYIYIEIICFHCKHKFMLEMTCRDTYSIVENNQ